MLYKRFGGIRYQNKNNSVIGRGIFGEFEAAYVNLKESKEYCMLDEIALPLFKLIGKVLGYLIIEFFFQVVCSFFGRIVINVITLWQYKKIIKLKNYETFESVFGLLVIFGMILYIVY